MQNKIYFIVGASDSPTASITTDLVNSYRANQKKIVVKALGRPDRIENSGFRNPLGTIEKIEENTTNMTTPIIFVGWRVVDHIDAIYNKYKDVATFIFTDSQGNTDEKYFEQFVTPEQIEEIAILQKNSISNFLEKNSITLDYQTVAQPIFDKDRNLNLSPTGIRIAVMGSL